MKNRELGEYARRLATGLIAKVENASGGELEEVFRRVEKALPFLAEQCDEGTFVAVLVRALARPAVQKKSTDVLVRNYTLLRELCQRTETKNAFLLLGLIELDLGLFYLSKRDFNTAALHFTQSLACDEQIGDVESRLDSLWNLGLALEGGERFPEALACFERALSGYAADGDRGQLARFQLKHGDALAGLRRYAEARLSLEAAFANFKDVNDMQGAQMAATHLVEVCSELEDRPAAKRYLELSLRLLMGA